MRAAPWLIICLLACCCLPVLPTARAAGTALAVTTNLAGTISGLASAGDMVLLAEGAGVARLDLHDPNAPAYRAHLALPARANGIAMAGPLAAVALGQAGLQIIDLGDPTALRLRGIYLPPPQSDHMLRVTAAALDGPLAYVLVGDESATGNAGGQIHIVDLSDPDRPTLLGASDTSGWPVALQVRGQVAYVASRSATRITGGLEIFGVGQPQASARMGFVPNQAYGGYGIEVANGFAYVARVGVFDVRDPAAPRKTAPLSSDILRVSGAYAYGIAPGDDRVAVFDLADPGAPRQVATVATHAADEAALRPVDLVIAAGQLALVDEGGLRMLSLSDPARPRVIGQLAGSKINSVFRAGTNVYAGAEQTWQLSADGAALAPAPALSGQFLGADSGRAFVARLLATLQVIDLANLAAPPLGTLPLPADPQAAGMRPGTAISASALSDGRLYLGLRHLGTRGPALNELVIIDVHDSYAPQLLGRITLADGDGPAGIAVASGRAYVVAGGDSLAVVDVRDPSRPTAAGQIGGMPQASRGIVAAGGWLYVAGAQALAAVDARDPAATTVRAAVALPGNGWHMALDGSRLAVGTDSSLAVVSVADPAQPMLLGSLPLPEMATAVTLMGDRALVALGDSGLRIVSLSATAAPPPAPPADARCFPETGQCISGPLRAYWERNGGLPVFGYPISAQGSELIEGRAITAQWFERNRLELHPENAAPYDVLIGRVGADRLAQAGRDWRAMPTGAPTAGCRFFAETGHSLCGTFLTRWRASGLDLDGRPGRSEAESLALFGLPLSEPQPEQMSDGKVYTVQWFERARIELHPELGPKVALLGLLGNELRATNSGE